MSLIFVDFNTLGTQPAWRRHLPLWKTNIDSYKLPGRKTRWGTSSWMTMQHEPDHAAHIPACFLLPFLDCNLQQKHVSLSLSLFFLEGGVVLALETAPPFCCTMQEQRQRRKTTLIGSPVQAAQKRKKQHNKKEKWLKPDDSNPLLRDFF